MRRLLALAAVAAVCLVVVDAAFIRATHRGALNRRLTQEQLTQQSLGDVQPQWLTQKLDHQDLSSTATFQQKYYVVDDFFTAEQPRVLFMLGGEGPVAPSYVSGHFIVNQYAQQFSAMLVALEHRFYGSSVPGNDSSTKNLKYLSSAQALEDLVTFHEQITAQYNLPAGTQWVVFGGSYSGALSAWARLKYPNLFVGSFAASAPVQAEVDFSQYFQVVMNSLGPQQCGNVVLQANNAAAALLNSTAGQQQLQSLFGLCATPQSENDQIMFLESLSGPISDVVQYSDDNNNYLPFDVANMCDQLVSAPTPLQGLVNVWNAYNTFHNQTGCYDASWSGYIDSMQGTSDGRSWTWQTCIEFGYFQTGDGAGQPFSPLISLDSFLQQCQEIFGQPLKPNVAWINAYYGGDGIVTSNTVFTNGVVDPWHALGTYQQFSPASQSDAILIDGTAHCADLYPPRDSDLPGLKQARAKQTQLLSSWFANGDKHHQPRKPKNILTE